MMVMGEKEIREKLQKAKASDEQNELEKKQVIENRVKARRKLEENIKSELAEWEKDFPKGPEIIDEKPFAEGSGFRFYLLKKKGDTKTHVLVKRGEVTRVVQSVDYFMETFAATDEMLRLLQKRIPEFIEYLSNKVES